jgi:hypothetical protein
VPSDHRAPPRGAKYAAIIAVAIVGFIIVSIFVGFNLQHAKDVKSGNIDPAGTPKSATDLQAAPSQPRPQK